VSELDILRQRKELVVLSADLQRATLSRRLGRIQGNPLGVATAAAVRAASRPMVWRLGTAAMAFAVRAYRKRSERKRLVRK
jgi:hypothetical protein